MFSSRNTQTASAMLLTALTMGCSEAVTPANARLRTFPDQHPAASVEKIEVPGAKHLFVHIGQAHIRPESIDKPRHTGTVRRCQEQIGRVLETLRTSWRLERIYAEGVGYGRVDKGSLYLLAEARRPKNVDAITDEDLKNELLRARAKGEEMATASELEKAELRTKIQILERAQGNEAGAFMARILVYDERERSASILELMAGASGKFAAKGLLTVMGMEDPKFLELQETANPTATALSRENNSREDFFMRQVTADGVQEACFILGGIHDLRDNLEAWNRENPDAMASLIVVMPTEVADFLTRMPEASRLPKRDSLPPK